VFFFNGERERKGRREKKCRGRSTTEKGERKEEDLGVCLGGLIFIYREGVIIPFVRREGRSGGERETEERERKEEEVAARVGKRRRRFYLFSCFSFATTRKKKRKKHQLIRGKLVCVCAISRF